MVFGFFKKKDPICGMKQEKGKGIEKHSEWFCSQDCLSRYESKQKKQESASKGCCGH